MIRRALTCAVIAAVTAAICLPAQAEEKLFYENRGEIPVADTWNLKDIVASTQEWETLVATLESRLPELDAYKGKLSSSAETLAAALDLHFELERILEDIYVYAAQWQRTDTRDPEANRFLSRAQSQWARFDETVAFMRPEIAQIDAETLATLRGHEALASYGHYLDNVKRTKAFMRSQEVEETMAGASLLAGAPSDVYQSLVSADISWPTIKDADGEEVTVVPGLFYSFMASQDRRVRRDAALALFATYEAFGNSLAGTYAASVHKDIWHARTRGYGSTLEMALNETNVPRSVVDTLVGTVHDNVDAIHSYVALRKKVLGLEDFHIYDLYVSMVPSVDMSYTYDEGWALAMQFWTEILGEDYAAVAAKARADRWVDVYPSAGKRGGAFSWGTYNSHPYLFLNWGGTLGDVFTLVHEMGHSVHTYLATTNQPYHDSGYSLFVAEVASVASESLFFEWMLARTEEPEKRLALLNYRMTSITGTFLRQIFFHEFEAEAHAMAERGEPVTKGSLNEIWSTSWQEYYGPEATLDPEFAAGWARIPHFYRTFYVWVYATSFAAGEAIAGRFRAGDETAVEDYLRTLKLGGSVYPMEALSRAGVDMNDPDVIRTVMVRYRSILEEMEKLLTAK